jgi:hypothetical protein
VIHAWGPPAAASFAYFHFISLNFPAGCKIRSLEFVEGTRRKEPRASRHCRQVLVESGKAPWRRTGLWAMNGKRGEQRRASKSPNKRTRFLNSRTCLQPAFGTLIAGCPSKHRVYAAELLRHARQARACQILSLCLWFGRTDLKLTFRCQGKSARTTHSLSAASLVEILSRSLSCRPNGGVRRTIARCRAVQWRRS